MKHAVLPACLAAAIVALAACEPADRPQAPDEAVSSAPEDEAPSAAQPSSHSASRGPFLIEAWRTEGFSTPAAAIARADGSYLVSNIAGTAFKKDGTGWIALVSPEGQLLDDEFATGMDAPDGMEIDRGVLYVADIDRVHLLNPDDGTRHRAIEVAGAEGLTGIAAWNAGLFLADAPTGRIYQLSGDAVDLVFEDEQLIGVKHIEASGDTLLATIPEKGTVLQINAGGDIRTLADGIPGANSVASVEDGYLVSAAPGQLWWLSATGEATEILNTQDEGIMQNGLTIAGETVLVANEVPGTVTAWHIDRE